MPGSHPLLFANHHNLGRRWVGVGVGLADGVVGAAAAEVALKQEQVQSRLTETLAKSLYHLGSKGPCSRGSSENISGFYPTWDIDSVRVTSYLMVSEN